jgi:hypothetical protein
MKYIKKIQEFIEIDKKHLIESLIEKVENDCKYLSDTGKVYNHKSYKEIIKIGNYSIPFLLEKLNDNTAMFWIKAIEEISGISSVGNKSNDIIANWKKWAQDNEF